jgi:ABC-type Zn2+ transport system substrate-binding protein/surface adhesin
MKNMSSLTTSNDIPGVIELTDEDLAQITAGNGFDASNDGNHHHNRNDHRRDHNRHDHRRDHNRHDHRR